MGAVNPIHKLADDVSRRFPEARVQIDPAAQPNGPWFLDISLDRYQVVVEWQAHQGFGITASPDSAYGEGADESYSTFDAALVRLLDLLQTRGRTEAALLVG